MSLLDRTERSDRTAIRNVSLSDAVTTLQHQLQSHPSFATISRVMQANPQRARNEASAMVKLILDGVAWDMYSIEQKDDIAKKTIDAMFGLGPLESLLANGEVTEIMINGTSHLYVERNGVLEELPAPFSQNEEITTLIDRILGPLGRHVDELSPMVDARLANGFRVNAIIPPISPDGPVVTIRKFSEEPLTLDNLAGFGSIEKSVRDFLIEAVKKRKNMAVSGGTGSGKTTLLNALSCCIPTTERIITIEDLAELRFSLHPHVVRLEARPANTEGCGQITIRDLVNNALRMRPDRIIVGECRGAEALDMLQAMNTGHDGSLTTLHANSPYDAISRLITMVRYAVDLPVDVIEQNISGALDFIVQVQRSIHGKRFLQTIAALDQPQRAADSACSVRVLYQRDSFNDKGTWTCQNPFEIPSLGDKESIA